MTIKLSRHGWDVFYQLHVTTLKIFLQEFDVFSGIVVFLIIKNWPRQNPKERNNIGRILLSNEISISKPTAGTFIIRDRIHERFTRTLVEVLVKKM